MKIPHVGRETFQDPSLRHSAVLVPSREKPSPHSNTAKDWVPSVTMVAMAVVFSGLQRTRTVEQTSKLLHL